MSKLHSNKTNINREGGLDQNKLSIHSINILINAIENNNGCVYPLPKYIVEMTKETLEAQIVIFPLYQKGLIRIDEKAKNTDKELIVGIMMNYTYSLYGKKGFMEWMKGMEWCDRDVV